MENREKHRKKQTKTTSTGNAKSTVNGKQGTPSTVKDCLLNRRQMCESLGISGPGFDRWGVEPVERIGNQSFYDVRSVLDNRIESMLHRPDPSSGEKLDPIQEQARLAKEKADAQELKNAQARGEQIPAEAAALIFGRIGSEMAAILDSLEANIKRRVPSLTATELGFIKAERVRLQNLAASVGGRLEEFIDELIGATDSGD